MTSVPRSGIPATYMRGGTSKGVFFQPGRPAAGGAGTGEARDRLLLRVIGSSGPLWQAPDGMGGATSKAPAKTVILAKSGRPDHDVDYLFGQVSIDRPSSTGAETAAT